MVSSSMTSASLARAASIARCSAFALSTETDFFRMNPEPSIRAEAAGTRYMLVEQDDCHVEDPIECLRRSYVNVTERFPETK